MKGLRWGGTLEEVVAAMAAQKESDMTTPYNQISQDITDQMVTDIVTAIVGLEQKLTFCTSLTDKQRQTLLKLGDANKAFSEKSIGYMGTNPEYISMLYPMTEVNKDVNGVAQIDKFLSRLQLALRKVEDTRMLMGSDIVHAGVAYMHNAGEAAYRGKADAEPIYKDLSDSYPGGNPGKVQPAAKTPKP
jgi:hypothetical protein